MGAAPVPQQLDPLPERVRRASELVGRGINVLESGSEDLAYELFVQACKANPSDPRAWFWRAKTSSALSEVIACLETAASFAPNSDQVRVNLEMARGRMQREQTLSQAATLQTASPAAPPSPTPAPPFRLVRIALAAVCSLVAASACLVLGVIWLAAALPDAVVATLDKRTLQVLELLPRFDLATLDRFVNLQLPGGYDPLSALPYALGFYALLAAAGLMRGEGWARWTGPVLAITSAALLISSPEAPLGSQPLVALSTLVAVGGPLTALRPSHV